MICLFYLHLNHSSAKTTQNGVQETGSDVTVSTPGRTGLPSVRVLAETPLRDITKEGTVLNEVTKGGQ